MARRGAGWRPTRPVRGSPSMPASSRTPGQMPPSVTRGSGADPSIPIMPRMAEPRHDAAAQKAAEELADRQLRVIAEVAGLASAAGIEVWLRGGWAMDFFLGEVTRPHVDVDWFCWAADADRLAALLHARGYTDDPD